MDLDKLSTSLRLFPDCKYKVVSCLQRCATSSPPWWTASPWAVSQYKSVFPQVAFEFITGVRKVINTVVYLGTWWQVETESKVASRPISVSQIFNGELLLPLRKDFLLGMEEKCQNYLHPSGSQLNTILGLHFRTTLIRNKGEVIEYGRNKDKRTSKCFTTTVIPFTESYSSLRQNDD